MRKLGCLICNFIYYVYFYQLFFELKRKREKKEKEKKKEKNNMYYCLLRSGIRLTTTEISLRR